MNSIITDNSNAQHAIYTCTVL